MKFVIVISMISLLFSNLGKCQSIKDFTSKLLINNATNINLEGLDTILIFNELMNFQGDVSYRRWWNESDEIKKKAGRMQSHNGYIMNDITSEQLNALYTIYIIYKQIPRSAKTITLKYNGESIFNLDPTNYNNSRNYIRIDRNPTKKECRKLKIDKKHNYGFKVISKARVRQLFRQYKKWIKYVNKHGLSKAREINYSPLSKSHFEWGINN